MAGKVITDLEELAEGIGSYLGMLEGLNQQTYMDSVLDRAFRKADGGFTKHAVSQAMSDPERLGHMWQFGTAGITRGDVRFANPAAASSRLWKNHMTGTGKVKTISWTFKTATGFVPALVESETGVDQSVLDKLKVNTGQVKYKFPNRAFVYEMGQTVHLKPVNSKRLFIPTKQEGLPTGKYWRRWGYSWAMSHSYSPGDFSGATGAFSGMYSTFWQGIGADIMYESMVKSVDSDLKKASKTISPSGRMVSAKYSDLKAAVTRGKKKTRKQWTIKTKIDGYERNAGIL